MDRVPFEIHTLIVSYLDTPELLTCRLVSHYWEEVVGAHLAQVTHVKWNQSALEDSPIANILVGGLLERRFKCCQGMKSNFFSFIAQKCPKLKVFSSLKQMLETTYILQLPTGLTYFEVGILFGPSERHPFSRLTSLIACRGDFCVPCHLNRQIAYKNICSDPYHVQGEHPKFNTLTPEVVKTLRWYDYTDGATDDQVDVFPACESIEILSVKFYRVLGQNAPPFFYPKLKYFKVATLNEGPTSFINSLQHHTQLRAIEVEQTREGGRFLKFTSTLEHLQFLRIQWIESSEDVLTLQVNNSLKFLYIETRNSLTLSSQRQDKLQFLRLRCTNHEAIVFNFPSLTEVSLQFDEGARIGLQQIDSLLHSPNLKSLSIEFYTANQYCTNETVKKFVKLVNGLNQLKHLSVHGMMDTWEGNEPLVLDLSQHHDLMQLRMDFNQYNSKNKTTFELILGQTYYSEINFTSQALVLKKAGLNYRSCHIDLPACPIIVLPNHPVHSLSFDFTFSSALHPLVAKNLKQMPVYIADHLYMFSRYVVSDTTWAADFMGAFVTVFKFEIWIYVALFTLIFWALVKFHVRFFAHSTNVRDDSLYEVLTHLFQVETIDYEGLAMSVISFVVTLLSFYVINYLTNSMSTDIVVVNEPRIIRTYDDVLAIPKVEILFAQSGDMYDRFEKAPPHTVEGKMWKKILESVDGDTSRLVFHVSGTDFADTQRRIEKLTNDPNIDSVYFMPEANIAATRKIVCIYKACVTYRTWAAEHSDLRKIELPNAFRSYSWGSRDPNAREFILHLVHSAFFNSPFLKRAYKRSSWAYALGSKEMFAFKMNVLPVPYFTIQNPTEGDIYRKCLEDDYRENLPYSSSDAFSPKQYKLLVWICAVLLLLATICLFVELLRKFFSKPKPLAAFNSASIKWRKRRNRILASNYSIAVTQ